MTISTPQEYDKIDLDHKPYGEGIYRHRNRVLSAMVVRVEPRNILELAASYHYLMREITDACGASMYGVPNIFNYACTNFSSSVVQCMRENAEMYAYPAKQYFVLDANDLLKPDTSLDDYDTVICTSLEHLEHDRKIIETFRKGMNFFFCVPNFTAAGHFRYFENEDAIKERYGDLLDIRELVGITAGKAIKFVGYGVRV